MHQIRAVSLYCYLDVASAVGIDGRRLLAEEGISPLSLDDTEARLPALAAVRLLERSAELSGLDSFGIRMAQCRSFASLGPISLLLERLNSVGEVVSAISALRRTLNDVIFVSVEQRAETVSVTFNLVPPHGQPQAADLTVALGYLAIVGASHGRWAPECVHFTHSPPRDLKMFQRFFNTPLSFNDSFNGFSFSRASMDIRLPLADTRMAQNAVRLLSNMPLPAIGAPTSDHTRHVICLLLPNGKATISEVAASLNQTPRMLQRQLKAEGQTFAGLLNEVKRDLATRFLRSSKQSMISIAGALGYANAAAFSRWFVREFGRSPSKWRKAQLTSGLDDHLDVIFSLKDGEVWASWLDLRPSVILGPQERVIAMMSNYIRQTDVSERLLRGTSNHAK